MENTLEAAPLDEWSSEEEKTRMNDESDLKGVDSEDGECCDWPWLKAVSLSSDLDGKVIGSCHGKVINREPIRATFYRDIEDPTSDTSAMGFDLFDHLGNLNDQYIQHDIKLKGSGVWGKELNRGEIFLIEEILIH